ncbi:MAG: hypothetical protein DWQ07_24535 [Chloroflexi bacterium]|nr:MAG: hypothetical protein DWQ07_24535 [Chloroflexota bacterium]MBL1196301.1 hypothetical protein [Chloroflexota bacterium]NOH13596.1 hypothetical protein [Chloroflexota bacterium]
MSQDNIANAIREIETSGGFAIFLADEGKNYYMQVSIQANQSQVYGEAVGNGFLADDTQLSSEALSRLEELGWSLSGSAQSNYSQIWEGVSANVVAKALAITLQEVYGWNGSSELGITVERD